MTVVKSRGKTLHKQQDYIYYSGIVRDISQFQNWHLHTKQLEIAGFSLSALHPFIMYTLPHI